MRLVLLREIWSKPALTVRRVCGVSAEPTSAYPQSLSFVLVLRRNTWKKIGQGWVSRFCCIDNSRIVLTNTWVAYHDSSCRWFLNGHPCIDLDEDSKFYHYGVSSLIWDEIPPWCSYYFRLESCVFSSDVPPTDVLFPKARTRIRSWNDPCQSKSDHKCPTLPGVNYLSIVVAWGSY